MADTATSKLSEFSRHILDARRVSTPLLAVTTSDPGASADAIAQACASGPVLSWDFAAGLRPYSQRDIDLHAYRALEIPPEASRNPLNVLITAYEKLPDGSTLIMINGHLILEERMESRHTAIQAIWNLRDAFKMNQRSLILVGHDFVPPPELANDFHIVDDPLPTDAELREVVVRQYQEYREEVPSVPEPSEDIIREAVDALGGLAMFPAEQAVAMSMRREGLQIGPLWDRKRRAISQTEGLTVHQSDARLDDLLGLDNVIAFGRELSKARAFKSIVFIDEIDKATAGGMADHVGDSGVSRDQIAQLLMYIENTKSLGLMLAGVAGTGKTQFAMALGAESGVPMITLDLGGMKNATVGGSEGNIRRALKVITAISRGRVLFIGTANKTAQFTPEFRRRFPDQFFFDLPTAAARRAIWPVYIQKFGLSAEQATFPEGMDDNWTGYEIERVCARAALFHTTVVNASKFIIPVYTNSRRDIDALRKEADGRFLSASHDGYYRDPGASTASSVAPSEQRGTRKYGMSTVKES